MRNLAMLTLFMVVYWRAIPAQENALSSSDAGLSYTDSLSIFSLIDSLLVLRELEASQLAVRMNYNSNVLSAGRTLGIQQFGLSPGISYYHKSGVYADLSAFWSRDFDPSYYLTIASLGYMHLFSKRLSAMAAYDRYFYNVPDPNMFIPYKHAFTVSPSVDFKYLSFRLDYSYFFGDASAHRIMPGIVFNLERTKIRKIDRVAITPACYLLYGDETISEIQFPYTLREVIRRQRQGLPWYLIIDKQVWGIMNYSFTLPVFVTVNKWNFSASYSYSIPKALTDEPLALTSSGFLSASVMYYISLKSSKEL